MEQLFYPVNDQAEFQNPILNAGKLLQIRSVYSFFKMSCMGDFCP